MTLSSIRYKSALSRFNSPSLATSIAKPQLSPSSITPVKFEGFNPNTGKHKFKTASGEDVEAVNTGKKGSFKRYENFIVSQNNVVG